MSPVTNPDIHPNTAKFIALSPVLNQLVDEAVANGMSRRNAIRKVTKIVNDMWKAGKLDIYAPKG